MQAAASPGSRCALIQAPANPAAHFPHLLRHFLTQASRWGAWPRPLLLGPALRGLDRRARSRWFGGGVGFSVEMDFIKSITSQCSQVKTTEKRAGPSGSLEPLMREAPTNSGIKPWGWYSLSVWRDLSTQDHTQQCLQKRLEIQRPFVTRPGRLRAGRSDSTASSRKLVPAFPAASSNHRLKPKKEMELEVLPRRGTSQRRAPEPWAFPTKRH